MTPIEIAAAIRYQLAPIVTTCGPCSRGCGRSARGSKVCAVCLTVDLGELVGVDLSNRFLRTHRDAAAAWAAIEDVGE